MTAAVAVATGLGGVAVGGLVAFLVMRRARKSTNGQIALKDEDLIGDNCTEEAL